MENVIAFILFAFAVNYLSSIYMENQMDKAIDTDLNKDITFIASVIDVKCSVSNADFKTSDGINKFLDNIDRATKRIESFDVSSDRVKHDLIALTEATKKMGPLMSSYEKINSDSDPGIIYLISMIGIGLQTDSIKSDADRLKISLRDSMDEYNSDLRKRTKEVALKLNESTTFEISKHLANKDDIKKYMSSSLENALREEYESQSFQNNGGCFDEFVDQISKQTFNSD